MSPRPQACSPSPYTSTSLRLWRASLCVGLRFATLSRGTPCGGHAKKCPAFKQLEQTPSKFHSCTPAVCLQSSRARLPSSRFRYRLHACSAPRPFNTSTSRTPTTRLPSSREVTSMSAPPQRTFRVLYLYDSRAPFLYAYTPAARHAPSIPPHITPAARLPRGHLYICTPAARLHRSIPPRLHACSMTPELHTSTSARLQHDSRAPELLRQTPTRPLRASRANSIPRRLHACSTTPELPSSIPPRLHARRVPPEL